MLPSGTMYKQGLPIQGWQPWIKPISILGRMMTTGLFLGHSKGHLLRKIMDCRWDLEEKLHVPRLGHNPGLNIVMSVSPWR